MKTWHEIHPEDIALGYITPRLTNLPLRRIIHATCGQVCYYTINPSDWSFQRTSQKQICCMCRGELCESNTYFDRKCIAR